VTHCLKDRPLKQHRPSLTELPDLFDRFGGNIVRLAAFLEYKPRQVNRWIAEAAEPIRIGLLERLAQARATEARAKLLRPEIQVFIIPSEIKTLVSLYYRCSWDELQALDVTDILNLMDCDPEKPPSLRYKLSWPDLKEVVVSLDAQPTVISGVTYEWWHQHVMLCWVGLGDESPALSQYDALPEVTPKVIEATVRLLIKRLGKYL